MATYRFAERADESEFSTVSLTKDSTVLLPALFTLCTSHKQIRMNNKGFFQVYGQDGNPWMSTELYSVPGTHGEVSVWGGFGEKWMFLGDIDEPKLFFWYHICQKVDTIRGVISVSVNGKILTNEVQVVNLQKNKPEKLGGHIVLGKSVKLKATGEYVDQQFEGFISNVNFYSGKNLSIETLSSKPCHSEGDLLPWSSPLWKFEGAAANKEDASDEHVCVGKNRWQCLSSSCKLKYASTGITCSYQWDWTKRLQWTNALHLVRER